MNGAMSDTTTNTAAPAVNYKIGNEKLVKLTDKAGAKLSSLLTRQGRPNGALRVAVIGGGCSGLQYKMDLVDGPANRDIMVMSQEVRVVIDPKSALFVRPAACGVDRRGGTQRAVPPPERFPSSGCGRRLGGRVRRAQCSVADPA